MRWANFQRCFDVRASLYGTSLYGTSLYGTSLLGSAFWGSRILGSTILSTAVLGTALVTPTGALAEAPLDGPLTRLGAFSTAHVNRAGTLEFNIGTTQTNPSTGTGTGNQLYFGGASYAVTDRLTAGLDFMRYHDPPVTAIAGSTAEIVTSLLAGSIKYQAYEAEGLRVAAQVSAESFLRLESGFWGGRSTGVFAGSVKLPVSYALSDTIEAHVTPGVSVFPDTVAGTQFYGTVAHIGAGLSLRPSERLAFYGSVDVPVSGANTVTTSGAYTSEAVWTIGGRYNVTPKAALDLYATNGLGISPATAILTHWPGGDEVLYGIRLNYTPGQNIPSTYRGPVAPVTARQSALQQDGFSISTADVIEPGQVAAQVWGGTGQNAGVALSFSPDRDGEVFVAIEDFAQGSTPAGAAVPTTEPRYMIGAKLRLLDQNNGDAFSLAGRGLFGRQIDQNVPLVGVFYGEIIASYQVNDSLSVAVNPQIAAWGNSELLGLGAGVNYDLGNGLELIAEATATGRDATDPTWAAGLRYGIGDTGLSVDLSASNAIGRYGIGRLIAQNDTKFALGFSTRVDLSGLR